MVNSTIKNTVLGVLAHVDAGKTTLSEGLLFTSGVLRKQGRVDHRDTLLDTHELEKERGITIFSSQASFTVDDRRFTLLDTPGHVDFSAEMERTLSVLDAGILVISGTDGVQAHTRTLWRLLSLYGIPVFIFVTKMDYARFSQEELLAGLADELGDGLVDFTKDTEERDDAIAMCSEEAMQEYLENGAVSTEQIRTLIASRELFPVYFGSGLKLEGLQEFLRGLHDYTELPRYGSRFAARVFKITHDESGNKIAHLKMLGGTLKVKDLIKETGKEEKVNQIRVYTGERFTSADSGSAGDIIAVTGLSEVRSGDELGEGGMTASPVLEPVMRYAVVLEEGKDPMTVLPLFRRLEEEDPMLKVTWNSYLQEIQVGLMGEVQSEILKSLVYERFGLNIELTRGHVLYRETIKNTVEGVGHYEPLRHYAEVHLILEPLPRGAGLVFTADVSEDLLDRNWQRLVLQHLVEKQHIGVLTGSPITDMKITLSAGRAHLKHTEGGDFRQATYRAVRQGLMSAESVLLEPFYRFRISAPQSDISRVMNDLKAMGGTFFPPVYDGTEAVLSGRAPVSEMNDYQKVLTSFTGGRGRLLQEPDGYDICHNAEEVVRELRYVPEADAENSPDSIFCAHGAGFLVKWDEAPRYMHLESTLNARPVHKEIVRAPKHNIVSDSELEEIMLREFGPIRRKQYGRTIAPNKAEETNYVSKPRDFALIVDGYNVIFAWEELKTLASGDIGAARERLIHILSNYSAYKKCETVLVFDGYRVPGNKGEQFDYQSIHVVYTKERESGDLYIERMIGQISRTMDVRVVTSDGMIQLSALRKGVTRISAQEFERIVTETEGEITDLIENARRDGKERIGDILKDREDLKTLPEESEEKDKK